MLEPVQSCFTFYHPDGKSSPHIYSDQSKLLENAENNTQIQQDIYQQSLVLFSLEQK